jgi:hypothetical protein
MSRARALSPLSDVMAEVFHVLEPEIKGNPELGLAEWTGIGLRKAIRWRVDGKTYSASGLVKHILSKDVHDVDTLAGPQVLEVAGRTYAVLPREHNRPGSPGGRIWSMTHSTSRPVQVGVHRASRLDVG